MQINPNKSTTNTQTESVSQAQSQPRPVQQVASSNLEGIESSKSLAEEISGIPSEIQTLLKDASTKDKELIQQAFEGQEMDIDHAQIVHNITNKKLQKQVAEYIVHSNTLSMEGIWYCFRMICSNLVDEKLLTCVMNPKTEISQRERLTNIIKDLDKCNQAWASIGQDSELELSFRENALGFIYEKSDNIGKYQDLYDDTALSIVKNFNYDKEYNTAMDAITQRLAYADNIQDQQKRDEAYYTIFIDKNNPITDLNERLSILENISKQSQHLFTEDAFSYVEEVLSLEGLEQEHIEKLWFAFSRIASMNFNYDMLMAIMSIPDININFCMYLMSDFMNNHIPNAIPEDDLENSTALAA